MNISYTRQLCCMSSDIIVRIQPCMRSPIHTINPCLKRKIYIYILYKSSKQSNYKHFNTLFRLERKKKQKPFKKKRKKKKNIS